ncbi:MAG: PAC2 family protein [Candidatus Bathyarchaeota archaeon]
MKTFFKELKKVVPIKPTLLEGFPGLGYVGKITISYMIKQLSAKKFAELYSPYFPHHVITNLRGGARLPRAELYFWKNPVGERDLIFLTTDTQAQTVQGQYEVVDNFLTYAKKKGVTQVVSIGGFSSQVQKDSPSVVCVSTSKKLLDEALRAGARISPVGNPIVGLAGLTLGLARFKGIDALCILGETAGHMPDPAVSKNVLQVIQRFLSVDFDLKPLDKEIERVIKTLKEMENIQQKMDGVMKKSLELDLKKTTYIA